MVVANHSSHYDALVLLCALPLREVNTAFAVAAKDYFFSTMWRGVVSLAMVNALPFDRKVAKQESLELCADVLQVGRKILVMFPEGTRSEDGLIHPFKRGIGKLVAGRGIPVVPAYLDGAARAWPKRAAVPSPRRIRVIFGTPRTFEGVPSTEEGWKEIAATLESDVRELSAHRGS